jgi:uncharacterized cupredoxin-like copper-binding protein
VRFRIYGAVGAMVSMAIFGALLAACGGSGETTSASQTATKTEAAGGAGGQTVKIEMGEFYFAPSKATAKAGKTTIEAPNKGSIEHELVLFKTNKDPAKLPTEANGGVDEEKLDKEAEEAGEIADVEAGETKSEEFVLTPGKYVVFCNLPGHYAQGMYGTLVVTK